MEDSNILRAPSFSNQKSNLSALAASLATFSRKLQLEARSLRLDRQTDEHHFRRLDSSHNLSQYFLGKQQDRLTRVEESLLRATEYILPIDSQRMTVTELAQTCASLHSANVRKMEKLDRMLHRAGVYSESEGPPYNLQDWQACSWEDLPEKPNRTTTTITPPSWQSVPPLQPLEQLVETDNETDGTVTPGSAYFFSPPLSAASEGHHQGTPNTPATPPALASLHFSANTASVLKQKKQESESRPTTGTTPTMRYSLDAVESWRESRRSVLSTVSSSGGRSRTSDTTRGKDTTSDETITSGAHERTALDFVSRENIELSTSNEDIQKLSIPRTLQNTTVIGYDEASVLDDETVAATVATRLAVGRQRAATTLQPSAAFCESERGNVVEREPPLEARQSKTVKGANAGSSSRSTLTTASTNDSHNVLRVRGDALCSPRANASKGRRKGVSFAVREISPSKHSAAGSRAVANRKDSLSSSSAHSVREIIVDSNTSSYSTDLDESTLGTLTLNDTFPSPSKSFAVEPTQDGGESITSTPVLARYRVEADDSSIGVKVVPNERGSSRESNVPRVKDRLQKYNSRWNIPPLQPLQVATPKADPVDSNPMFFDNLISPNVTCRSNKKVFRRTPHPKKQAQINLPEQPDENIDPNSSLQLDLDDDASSLLPKSEARSRAGGSSSLSSSTAKKTPLTPTPSKHVQRSVFQGPSDCSSEPLRHDMKKHQSPAQRTPLTAAFVAKHMFGDRKLIESFAATNDSMISLEDITPTRIVEDRVVVDCVTLDEYERAPKVVRMQVTLNEVNAGVDALNKWLSEDAAMNSSHSPQLSESEIEMLMQESLSAQKSKTVLMSLCHWRRLSMRQRRNGGARCFQLNP